MNDGPLIDATNFKAPLDTLNEATRINMQRDQNEVLFYLAGSSLGADVTGFQRVAAMMIAFEQLPLSRTPDIQNISKEDMAFRLRLFEEERKEMYAALGISVCNVFQDLEITEHDPAWMTDSLDNAIFYSDQSQWDITEFADGIGDLKVILNGTAFRFAIPQDLVDWEIHCSNMTKFADDGSVLRREDGKILKGDNYVAPDIARILGLETEGVNEAESS